MRRSPKNQNLDLSGPAMSQRCLSGAEDERYRGRIPDVTVGGEGCGWA